MSELRRIKTSFCLYKFCLMQTSFCLYTHVNVIGLLMSEHESMRNLSLSLRLHLEGCPLQLSMVKEVGLSRSGPHELTLHWVSWVLFLTGLLLFCFNYFRELLVREVGLSKSGPHELTLHWVSWVLFLTGLLLFCVTHFRELLSYFNHLSNVHITETKLLVPCNTEGGYNFLPGAMLSLLDVVCLVLKLRNIHIIWLSNP